MASLSGIDFDDPNVFLDRIDPEQGTASFVPTSLERLQATAFLDGRSSFSSLPAVETSIDLMASASNQLIAEPNRLILHMSFCGSTQLARLIDESGAGIVLKEPHALVDLADWHRTLREHRSDDPHLKVAMRATLTLLSRRWTGASPTVIKPSNWANPPILEVIPGVPGDRILLVTIDRYSFLLAAFRGGRDRLAFLSRAASHFAIALGASRIVDNAIASATDPLDQAARLVMVAHALQEGEFAKTARALPDHVARLDYAQILSDPRLALATACEQLALEPHEGRMAAAALRLASYDAKQAGAPFSIVRQDEENRIIESHHQTRINQALEWAASALPVQAVWT